MAHAACAGIHCSALLRSTFDWWCRLGGQEQFHAAQLAVLREVLTDDFYLLNSTPRRPHWSDVRQLLPRPADSLHRDSLEFVAVAFPAGLADWLQWSLRVTWDDLTMSCENALRLVRSSCFCALALDDTRLDETRKAA